MDLKRIVFAFAAALALAACAPDTEDPRAVKLDKYEYDIGYEGGVIEVNFIAVASWHVTSYQEGITVSPLGGLDTNQPASFTMTIEKNPKTEERIFEVTFGSHNSEKIIKVTQEAAPESNTDNPDNPEKPGDPDGSTEDVIPGDNL